MRSYLITTHIATSNPICLYLQDINLLTKSDKSIGRSPETPTTVISMKRLSITTIIVALVAMTAATPVLRGGKHDHPPANEADMKDMTIGNRHEREGVILNDVPGARHGHGHGPNHRCRTVSN